MVCMTLNCASLTQFSVIRIIHLNVGLKCFFHLLICLLSMFVIIVRFPYIYVSQGSVEMHLPCGGMYNNHIIAEKPTLFEKAQPGGFLGF